MTVLDMAEVREVREALNTLPLGDVQILALYFSEGLTCREIALVLKVATARVHELVDQALVRVREASSDEKDQVAA